MNILIDHFFICIFLNNDFEGGGTILLMRTTIKPDVGNIFICGQNKHSA